MDAEKQVVILFGEVLNEHEVNFEIGGFSLKTRIFCSYYTLNSFEESWEKGKYGIKDVKQAMRELKAENINTYAVSVEDQARYYLPQMFGQNHYNILTSPVEMLQSFTKLYERIEKN